MPQGQSSIIIEGGYLCAAGATNKSEIVLEQIPNQLIIRDTVQLMGLGYGSGRRVVKVSEGLDLSGAEGTAMWFAARHAGGPVMQFKFSGIWNVPGPNMDGPFRLPQALWPYVTPQHSVYAQGPPSAGYWREGMVVWRALEGIPAGNETTSVPQYQPIQKFSPAAPGAPLGWVCTQGGQPGEWANVSGPVASQQHAQRQDREIAELREELAALRKMVLDGVGGAQ